MAVVAHKLPIIRRYVPQVDVAYLYSGLNVPWTVHHDINFEAVTNLMHKYLY